MAIVVEPYRDRPRVDLGAGWPEFIFHDALAARHLDAVRARFADLELAARATHSRAGRAKAAQRCQVRPSRASS